MASSGFSAYRYVLGSLRRLLSKFLKAASHDSTKRPHCLRCRRRDDSTQEDPHAAEDAKKRGGGGYNATTHEPRERERER